MVTDPVLPAIQQEEHCIPYLGWGGSDNPVNQVNLNHVDSSVHGPGSDATEGAKTERCYLRVLYLCGVSERAPQLQNGQRSEAWTLAINGLVGWRCRGMLPFLKVRHVGRRQGLIKDHGNSVARYSRSLGTRRNEWEIFFEARTSFHRTTWSRKQGSTTGPGIERVERRGKMGLAISVGEARLSGQKGVPSVISVPLSDILLVQKGEKRAIAWLCRTQSRWSDRVFDQAHFHFLLISSLVPRPFLGGERDSAPAPHSTEDRVGKNQEAGRDWTRAHPKKSGCIWSTCGHVHVCWRGMFPV